MGEAEVGVADPQAVRAAWRDLGHQLAVKRKAAKLSQQELARRTKYSRSSIANIEVGLQHVNRAFWEAVDLLLGATGQLLQSYDDAEALQRAHQRPRPGISASDVGLLRPTGSEPLPFARSLPGIAALDVPDAAEGVRQSITKGASGMPGQLATPRASPDGVDAEHAKDLSSPGEDIVDVLVRIQNLHRAVDPVVISGLESSLSSMLVEYETWERGRFIRSLIKKRSFVDSLISQSMQPGQRQKLFRIAGKVSGLLGYVEVGRESFPLARAYCAESFRLAELAEDADLQAWALGMQSFCEYYAGDYETARIIASHGLSYAKTGPQSVRLTINGVARAAGKLGDEMGVQRAVERAYALMSQNEVPTGLPSSVSLQCYSAAQTASNAVTAYVSLGDSARVQEFAALALPDIKKSVSPWSQALLKVDLATSMLMAHDADLERASRVTIDALTISSGFPIVSIRRRALEFIEAAEHRWGRVFSLDEVREALEAWSRGCWTE